MTNDPMCSILKSEGRALFYKHPQAIFTQLQTALTIQHQCAVTVLITAVLWALGKIKGTTTPLMTNTKIL